MNGKSCRSSLTIFLAVFVAATPVAPVYAQQGASAPPTQAPPAQAQPPARQIAVSNQDFTFGKRWFPNILGPYTPTQVPEPVLTNAPRIEQMVKDSKLTMSLQDAVDLALQNNLAIVIER
jgi:outer membrane protein